MPAARSLAVANQPQFVGICQLTSGHLL